MAVPIRVTPDTPESEQEVRARLDAAKVKHAKAVLAAYELLQQLHDVKVIDTLRGALGAGDTIVTKLAVGANTPESIAAMRNLVSIAKILSSIDPEFLHALAEELTTNRTVPPPSRSGFWRFIRMIASPATGRALVGTTAFLQAFGRALTVSERRRYLD
jgi:uncharacterized protein YjgD (DUF1641 family)